MRGRHPNFAVAASLAFTIFLWGGNNVGTKWLVQSWPPVTIGGIRFLCAGLVMVGLLRWTNWFGDAVAIAPELKRKLWWNTALTLAIYLICFNWALRLTSASHVALYLGASPVWALLWEERPEKSWRSLLRYGAAAIALAGVATLFWPALHEAKTNLLGEALGIVGSVLWTVYGREGAALGKVLPGAEVAAQTMWRTGVWLSPLAVVEVVFAPPWDCTGKALVVQAVCILGGGVVAYGFWNNALRVWPASRVLLFINLIPVSTMTWSHFVFGEVVARTFWLAMALIVTGVVLGQVALPKLEKEILPPE